MAWNVYTTRGRRSQYVHLQFWRPAAPAAPSTRPDNPVRYRLVGETVIQALWVGHNLFTLYPRDRIAVRRGDVLGIYFPKYNPIPYTQAPCRAGGANEYLFRADYSPPADGPEPSSYTSGGHGEVAVPPPPPPHEVAFDRAVNDCRQYSINATIMDERGQPARITIPKGRLHQRY